jgi:hypothetical protein
MYSIQLNTIKSKDKLGIVGSTCLFLSECELRFKIQVKQTNKNDELVFLATFKVLYTCSSTSLCHATTNTSLMLPLHIQIVRNRLHSIDFH